MPDDPRLAHEPKPTALSKAQEVAKAMGSDWQAADLDCVWMAAVNGPGLRSLTLNMGTWRAGRLTILGSISRLEQHYRDDRTERPWAHEPMPQISLDPTKDGPTIAKEIQRRLFDDYEAAYGRMAEKFETMKRVTAEREEVTASLRDLLEARDPKPHRNDPFNVHAKKVTLCVDGKDSIRFSHVQSFSLDQMKRLIAALPEVFGVERLSLDEAARRVLSTQDTLDGPDADSFAVVSKPQLDNLRAVIEGGKASV